MAKAAIVNEEHDHQPDEQPPAQPPETEPRLDDTGAVSGETPAARDFFTRELMDLVAMLESDDDAPPPPAADAPAPDPLTPQWTPPPAEERAEFVPHGLLDSIAQSMAALESQQEANARGLEPDEPAARAEARAGDDEAPETADSAETPEPEATVIEEEPPLPVVPEETAALDDDTDSGESEPGTGTPPPAHEESAEAAPAPPEAEVQEDALPPADTPSAPKEDPGEEPGETDPDQTVSAHEDAWRAGDSEEDELEALINEVDRDTAASAPEPDADEHTAVDQNMVDALLEEMAHAAHPAGTDEAAAVAGIEDDTTLDHAEMDDAIVGPAPAENASEPAAGPVNQELIDALLSQANAEEPGAQSVEPAAPPSPAAPAPDPAGAESDLLSQETLDQLIDQAREQERGGEATDRRLAGLNTPPPITEEDSAAAGASRQGEGRWARWRRRRAEAGPGRVARYLHANRARITASLVTGLLAALATFTALYQNPEQTPSLAALEEASQSRTLESAMRRARELMTANEHAKAAEILRRPIAEALPSPLRVEAEYLEAEAHYRALPPTPRRQEAEAVLGRIERVVASAPGHPRAPFALQWKGRLLESMDLLPSAQSAYASVIENYGGAPNVQSVLQDAARLALRRKKPETALECARQLIQQFPDSEERPEAELLIGDAYAMSGMLDEARALYVGTAEREAGQAAGGEALQRLGEMALARGQYDEAARLLNQRLETGTTTAGYDRVYLKLGQALRRAGRFEDARQYLNELINFFPHAGVIPQAYVELSQTLDSLGERPEALRIAQQAATRFPDDPAVLQNAGELYGRAGRALQAASLLEAADGAGANDPGVLLAAGRFYRDAALPLDALRMLERLRSQYPRAPQAVHGGIEAAMVLYGLGQASQAVERLERIVAATVGTNQRLPALTSLARIYRDMGLAGRVAEIAQQIAGISSEPQVQADAAVSLMEAGAYDEGLRLAARVDLTALSDRAAYRLLHAQGMALARFDPRRALEKLENAYLAYPRERTLEGDRDLLDAYLAAGQRAAARRIITEMEALVQANPVDSAHLVHAAVAWGNHLAALGDHREAARAYAMALDTAQRAGEMDESAEDAVLWAKYQRASALLQGSQYAESLPLLEEVAASGAPWANEAALKADYARAEQRLRTPPGATPGEAG